MYVCVKERELWFCESLTFDSFSLYPSIPPPCLSDHSLVLNRESRSVKRKYTYDLVQADLRPAKKDELLGKGRQALVVRAANYHLIAQTTCWSRSNCRELCLWKARG